MPGGIKQLGILLASPVHLYISHVHVTHSIHYLVEYGGYGVVLPFCIRRTVDRFVFRENLTEQMYFSFIHYSCPHVLAHALLMYL